MTKENFLYTIIGLLFGFSAAFVFVTYANQKAMRANAALAATSNANRQLPSNAVSDQRSLQAAIADATQKAIAAPNDFDSQMRAAMQLYQAERFNDALGYLVRANKLHPNDYDALRGLCFTSFEAGKLDDAEKWCKSALAKKSDDAEVRSVLSDSSSARR